MRININSSVVILWNHESETSLSRLYIPIMIAPYIKNVNKMILWIFFLGSRYLVRRISTRTPTENTDLKTMKPAENPSFCLTIRINRPCSREINDKRAMANTNNGRFFLSLWSSYSVFSELYLIWRRYLEGSSYLVLFSMSSLSSWSSW